LCRDGFFFCFSRVSSAQIAATDAGARGSGGTSVAAAVAAAAGRPIRARGTAVPAVRPQVLRAPVQQLGPVRAGGRLRDRRRVRVPLSGGRQRAATARPHRPAQERLLGRALEHHGYVWSQSRLICIRYLFFSSYRLSRLYVRDNVLSERFGGVPPAPAGLG